VPALTVTSPVGVPPLEVTVKVTATAWPTTEGLGVWPVIVVVVPAAPTVCATPADVLPAKFASPAYVAVRVFAPAVVGVNEQVPAATVPVQVSVPALTVTSPVGVPPPEVTVKVTAIAWPTAEGSGVCPVIVVVVPPAPTVCATPADVLPAKLASPAYVAVRVLVPAVVGVNEQVPAATVPVQVTGRAPSGKWPVGLARAGATANMTD